MRRYEETEELSLALRMGLPAVGHVFIFYIFLYLGLFVQRWTLCNASWIFAFS